MNEEPKSLREKLGIIPGDEHPREEVTPEELIARGLQKRQDEARRACQNYVEQCTIIAQAAKGFKDSTPDLPSFDLSMKISAKMKGLRAEYKALRTTAYKKLSVVIDKDFKSTVNDHFGMMDKIMFDKPEPPTLKPGRDD